MNQSKMTVLYVEDNEHDVIATKRAWNNHHITNPLFIVRDGEECMDYLYHRGKYSDPKLAPRPSLILLDLNMPRLDGLGVLKLIRKDESLKHIHVVVLTTSALDEDRIDSYQLGVKGFIRKPVGFENFSLAIRAINIYWELVELENGT